MKVTYMWLEIILGSKRVGKMGGRGGVREGHPKKLMKN
jgi:hypothetical protein